MSEAVKTGLHGRDAISVLRDAATIRRRCLAITTAVSEGRSAHFRLDRSRLDEIAARVERVTRAAYPDLQIPFHSRWRHFESGGVDRKGAMDGQLAGRSADEVARARIDLTVIAVLLDAGAGPTWRYTEADSGQTFSRSEGLGVASWQAFQARAFLQHPGRSLARRRGGLAAARHGRTAAGLPGHTVEPAGRAGGPGGAAESARLRRWPRRVAPRPGRRRCSTG